MPYNEDLANRTRDAIGSRPRVSEKKMFGGIAFLLDGKMFCGVSNDDLMVRVGPDHHESSLTLAHTRPMDFTGRPMNGYIFVGAEGTQSAEAIRKWVDLATTFVATLPAKTAKNKPAPRR